MPLFHELGLCKKGQNPGHIQKVLPFDAFSHFETVVGSHGQCFSDRGPFRSMSGPVSRAVEAALQGLPEEGSSPVRPTQAKCPALRPAAPSTGGPRVGEVARSVASAWRRMCITTTCRAPISPTYTPLSGSAIFRAASR